jgi:hypothetical protein
MQAVVQVLDGSPQSHHLPLAFCIGGFSGISGLHHRLQLDRKQGH